MNKTEPAVTGDKYAKCTTTYIQVDIAKWVTMLIIEQG
jgi:hypothetical protein